MENQPVVNSRKVIKISKKKFKIFIIIIVVLLILSLGGWVVLRTFGVQNQNSIAVPCIETFGVSCPGNTGYNKNKYNNNTYTANNSTQTTDDTREFLKMSYSANIQTRKIKDVITDIKNQISLADGRIDGINESTKYGYVRFVVPKSNFDDFKKEIETLTPHKLYTETVSAQNLLDQKQSIEEQLVVTTNSLLSLQKKLQDLTLAHNTAITTYQKQLGNKQAEISTAQNELSTLRLEIQKTTNNNTLATLRKQEASLIIKISTLNQNETSINQQITNENSNYALNKQSLDNQIQNANLAINNVEKKDNMFDSNIETVNGNININWVSYWQIAKIYSPIHPTFVILIIVFLGLVVLHKKKVTPKIEFV